MRSTETLSVSRRIRYLSEPRALFAIFMPTEKLTWLKQVGRTRRWQLIRCRIRIHLGIEISMLSVDAYWPSRSQRVPLRIWRHSFLIVYERGATTWDDLKLHISDRASGGRNEIWRLRVHT